MPTPEYLWVQQIIQGRGVRAVCDGVAARIAASASAIVSREGGSRSKKTEVTRSAGTRPLGRPFSRVGIAHARRADAQQELAQANGGEASATGMQLVGRAVSGARNPNP